MVNKHKSVWQQTIPNPIHYPSLQQDLQIDILIIGAGITGLTAAMELIAKGRRVAIIDAHGIGEGTTGYSTANLYLPVQPSLSSLQFKFGHSTVQTLLESRQAAINYIEKKVQEWQIDCHFTRRPLYLFTTDRKKNKFIEREMKILQQAGMQSAPCSDFPLTIPVTQAAVIPNQARFNPLQYLYGIAAKLQQQGGLIFLNTPAVKITEQTDNVQVATFAHTITASKVIIATHLPIGINKTHFLAYPYRSYAVAVKLKQEHYVNGNFWEIDMPFYAYSTHNVSGKDMDILIAAGFSHKIGHPKSKAHQAHFANIEARLRQYFDVASIEYQWSAQHYQSADGLPYIGLASRKSKSLYIGTGYHADGLTYGTVAGLLLADLICNQKNPWADIYDPNRFTPFASSLRFAKENTQVFFDYVKGYLQLLMPRAHTEIAPGEAKILNVNGKKCAAYRDDNNQLHMVSAICTHMACIVKWNDAEKTWDCPCHGSRFTTDGTVIEGPAVMPLANISEAEWK